MAQTDVPAHSDGGKNASPACRRRRLPEVRSENVTASLIGICGGSGSGKSRLATELADALGSERVSILPFDAYYKDLRHLPVEERSRVNFDHPESLDSELFGSHLDGLAHGLDVCLPVYDFTRHQRADDLTILPARDIIIAEGILLFAFPELVERFSLKVFREAPESVRFERRLERDVVERGRSPESVRRQFEESVGPMHDAFVEPSAVVADRVVAHSEELTLVVEELTLSINRISI